MGTQAEYSLQETWGPIRAILFDLTFSQIKRIVAKAGLDMTKLAHLSQDPPRSSTKDALLSAIDGAFGELEEIKQEGFIRVCRKSRACQLLVKWRVRVLRKATGLLYIGKH